MSASDSRVSFADHLFRYIELPIRLCGNVAGWIYFGIGAIVAYEVVMRYFFNAPTHWVEESARIGMVWATFLLFAACISERQLITITLITGAFGERGRVIFELINFLLLSFTAAILLWFSVSMFLDAIRIGRATATPLRVPFWIFYLPLCLGFGLVLLQTVAESIYIIFTGKRRKPDVQPEH